MEMCSGFIALLCFRPGRVCIAAVLVVDSWKTEEEEEEGKKNELSRLIHGQEDKKRTPSISFIPVNYSQDSTAAAAFFFFFLFLFPFFFVERRCANIRGVQLCVCVCDIDRVITSIASLPSKKMQRKESFGSNKKLVLFSIFHFYFFFSSSLWSHLQVNWTAGEGSRWQLVRIKLLDCVIVSGA